MYKIPAEFWQKLSEAIGVDATQCRRIIIDMQVDLPVWVYVEKIASDKFFELDWTDIQAAIQVVDAQDVEA